MATIPKPRLVRPDNLPAPAAPTMRAVAELEPERGYLSREVAELSTVNELTGEESVVIWDNGRTWKSPLRYIVNLARTESVPPTGARISGGGGRHTYERSVARAPVGTPTAGDLFLAVRDGQSIQLDVADVSGGGGDAATLGTQLPAYYLARANHTGTQLAATVSDFSEAVDDRAAALIQNGTGITWSYNDAGGTLTPTVSLASFSTTNLGEGTNLYFTDERAQDAVGAALTDSTTIDFTYTDASNTITAIVIDDSISNAKLANVATQTFKGRTTAGTGDPEDLTVAQAKTLLSLTGTNSGDQTITLTSDVTGSGTGSFATTIAAGVVTLAKMANMATASLIYRRTAGTGVPEVNTLVQLKTDLTLVKGDVGLGNVDNTSDATKNAAVAALTNKDITSGTNTFPTFNQSTTGSAATLTTARTIDGQSFNGSANITVIAPGTHAATSKATPVDADEVPLVDSAASNVLKRLTWANLKATLKTYLDTLYTTGPASSVDNAAARYDSTTGKLLQDSALLIADATGSLSRSGNGGIPIQGTNTSDSAAAGYVGEYAEGTLAAGSATALVTSTAKTVTSISLTAGDWDVSGFVNYVNAAGTTITVLLTSISLTDNTRASANEKVEAWGAGITGGPNPGSQTPITRLLVASTTTVYLVAQGAFSGGTLSAWGTIRARRMR